ncbi:MAG: hypothetical protein IIC11_10855, partial [Proteobacteria bacterium]|nr:hypothetical protein [Pseudomonadota bacterium]
MLHSHAGSVISDTHAEEKMAIFRRADDEEVSDVAPEPRIGQSRPVRPNNVSAIGPSLV